MNRIDKVVVFRSLREQHLRQILDIELHQVQARITESAGTKFVFECTDEAKEFLLREGIDLKDWERSHRALSVKCWGNNPSRSVCPSGSR